MGSRIELTVGWLVSLARQLLSPIGAACVVPKCGDLSCVGTVFRRKGMCGVISYTGCSLRASLCDCIKKAKMCSFRLQLNILTYATSGAGCAHRHMTGNDHEGRT